MNKLLLVSNIIALALLAALAAHFRVPQKAWRKFVVEERIPAHTETHLLNRSYLARRELFALAREENPVLLVAGDSHVQFIRWDRLLGREDVAERGIGGDTTQGLLHRLQDDADLRPQLVVIMIGTNDLFAGAEAAAVAGRIEAILERAHGIWPDAALLVIVPPPVARWVTDAEAINASAERLARLLPDAVEERPYAGIIDFYSRAADDSGYLKPEFTYDGIHLTAPAYQLLRSLIVRRMPDRNIGKND